MLHPTSLFRPAVAFDAVGPTLLYKESPVKRGARQKPEWRPVKRKRPVYLRATSPPESRSRGVAKAFPEFHLPAQLAEPENANRLTVGKRDRGAWHLGR